MWDDTELDAEWRDFVECVQLLSNDVDMDLDEAISYMWEHYDVPGRAAIFEEIPGGTFYSDSSESRWFGGLTKREAFDTMTQEREIEADYL